MSRKFEQVVYCFRREIQIFYLKDSDLEYLCWRCKNFSISSDLKLTLRFFLDFLHCTQRNRTGTLLFHSILVKANSVDFFLATYVGEIPRNRFSPLIYFCKIVQKKFPIFFFYPRRDKDRSSVKVSKFTVVIILSFEPIQSGEY